MHLADRFWVRSQCLPLFPYAVWSSSGQILLCARELPQFPTHTLPQFDSVAQMMNVKQYQWQKLTTCLVQCGYGHFREEKWDATTDSSIPAFIWRVQICCNNVFIMKKWGVSRTQCALNAGILLTKTLNESFSRGNLRCERDEKLSQNHAVTLTFDESQWKMKRTKEAEDFAVLVDIADTSVALEDAKLPMCDGKVNF